MELGKIKVVPGEIGGGFGGKTTVYLEPVALILSRKAGKPVKMVMERDEVFTSTGPTSAAVVRAKVGAKSDGTITAAEGWMAFVLLKLELLFVCMLGLPSRLLIADRPFGPISI